MKRARTLSDADLNNLNDKQLEALYISNYLKPDNERDERIERVYFERRQAREAAATSSTVEPSSSVTDLGEVIHRAAPRSSEENFDYVEKYRSRMTKMLASKKTVLPAGSSSSMLEDDKSCVTIDGMTINLFNEPSSADISLYQDTRLNFLDFKYDDNLPINRMRDEILKTLRDANVVIIQGSTGCGKTTQVPQIILDDHARRMLPCKIIVTQPRRIAAKSVAQRVSDVRRWPMGSVCGFKVNLEKRCSEQTRIFYVTTGYLLESVIANEKELDNYTHIVLDEVHDRDVDTDLTILFVKILLLKGYKGKVILMSATLDPTTLVEYFKPVALNNHVPILLCTHRIFEVKEFYLDELEELLEMKTEIQFKKNNPFLFNEQIELLSRLLVYLDEKERTEEENGDIVDGFRSHRGAMLIFVPGMQEIEQVRERLNELSRQKRLNIVCCILHSEIALDVQMRVHDSVAPGRRKVIISTSIAESSITVSDVKYVVDFCLTKNLSTNPSTNFIQLQLEWTSKSNMDQRRGRAGRVKNGLCYRLITRAFFQELNDFPTACIEREPLDKLILRIKRFFGKKKPAEVLSLSLTPPPLDNIERAVLYLKEAGGLSLYKKKELCANDGDLTFLGTVMASLPVDCKLAKMIMFGFVLGKLREAIIIASALSVKTIFSRYCKSNLEHLKSKLAYSNGLNCDFVSIVNAYNYWTHFEANMAPRMSYNEKREHFKNCGLDYKRLKELDRVKRKIEERLRNDYGMTYDETESALDMSGLACPEDLNNTITEDAYIDQCYIIKFMVAAAFYPNYYKTNVIQSENVERELNSKDPKSTVCVRGFSQLPVLYHQQLKKVFANCCLNRADPSFVLHYEDHRAFVEFKEKFEINKRIASGVYFSILLRRSRVFLYRIISPTIQIEQELKSLTGTQPKDLVSRVGVEEAEEVENAEVRALLGDLKEFKIKIMLVPEINLMWAVVNEDSFVERFDRIEAMLNSTNFEGKKITPDEIRAGEICACFHFYEPYKCGIYRAKILKVLEDGFSVEVLYIDYGNREMKDSNLLLKLDGELKKIPPQAFPCRIANHQIDTLVKNNRDEYQSSKRRFELLLNKIDNLKAKVYSIVNKEVRVTLINEDNPLFQFDIARQLVSLGILEPDQEPSASQMDHEQTLNPKIWGKSSASLMKPVSVPNHYLDSKLNNLRLDDHPDGTFPIQVRSPLETSLQGLRRCTETCRISVEISSANCVVLDDDHELQCSNLLVAHSCDQKEDNRLVLRNTTLFPKVKGLVSICLLIFSPHIELRYKDGVYTGALCGLGYDQSIQRSIYPENDIEDTFQVVIDQTDFSRINLLRNTVNLTIGNVFYVESLLKDPERKKLKQTQTETRMHLLRLLKEKRQVIEPRSFMKPYTWKQIDEVYYNPLNVTENRMKNFVHQNIGLFGPIRTVNSRLADEAERKSKRENF